MLPVRVLNSKEKRHIFSLFEMQWEITVPKEMHSQAWLQNADGKIYLCTRDIEKLPLDRLRIDRLGIYVGKLQHEELRLSIEGSQLFGPMAKKNTVELDAEQAHLWLKGTPIPYESDVREFVLVKHDGDFLGCGRLIDGKILNYVPKERRLKHTAEAFVSGDNL